MNEDLVELRLRNGGEAGDSQWKPFFQNLLRVLTDAVPESPSKETAALRARVVEYRTSFSHAIHPQEERQVVASCLKTCEQYLRRIQLDHTARETELTEMIAILREAAQRFIGDSTDFHTQLLTSADRFKTMSQLDDIRDLKRQLSAEVSSLEKVVEDKKQRDEKMIVKLSERVEVLQADLVKAEEKASIDPLTRIANRGAFDRALTRLIEAARKTSTPLTLAMIDVDHFKKVNDTHGHQVGDRVLLCTADWLRNSLRRTDFVARYGGEEFAVILHDADLTQAEERFNQVLVNIANRSYEYVADGEKRSVRFTVSCGIAQLVAHDQEPDLIQRADQALYDAKEKGRNRVVCRKPSRFAKLLGR